MLSKLLIKKFTPEHIDTPKARAACTALSSVTGIICNIFLFVLKLSAGMLSGSVSIVSDAFNNLSDCASCIVALLGGYFAAKPADKDHPFGHGRLEYLAAMLIAVLILFVGIELLTDSVSKIITPAAPEFSLPALAVLIISILVKLWMSIFGTRLGRLSGSSVILASAKDSRNDIIATSAAAAALIASEFTSLPVDGIAGVLVSLFILKCGFDIIKDTVDDLLGKPADSDTVKQIRAIILAHEKVIDVHDLIIHNYGPSHIMGSCHVEVDGEESFCAVHELVDHIEKRILEDTRISMTIHMDPAAPECARTIECREFITKLLSGLDAGLSFHDLRLTERENGTEVSFDLVVPFGCRYKNEQLRSIIAEELKRIDPCYILSVTFDRQMTDAD